MKSTSIVGMAVSLAIAAALSVHSAAAATIATSTGPVIETADIDRFYQVYDKADGHPTGEALQHDYIDPGSDGLHTLARMRHVTGRSIADAISKRPEMYSKLRQCLQVLPRVRERLKVSLHKLKALYPESRFPPITITVV